MARRLSTSGWLFSSLLLVPSVVVAQTEPAAPSDPSATPSESAAPTEPAASTDPAAAAPEGSAEAREGEGATSTSEEPSAADAPASAPIEPTPAEPEPVAVETKIEPAVEPAVTTTSSDVVVEDDAEESEVVVLGSSASRAAGSVHVIREAQLKRFEYDDAGAILTQTPGVYIRQEDGIGLRPNIGIRGANPNRSAKLTLMEDGILFGPAPYSAPAAYFFPLMTRMTQVRVVKGPSAIAYGPQTVGGAIDFISRPIPLDTTASLDLGLGQYGYSKGHGYFGTSTEQFGFLIEGARLQNTGFAELPSGADTGSTRNEWVAKASYVLDPNATIRNEFLFKLQYTDEVSNETYLGQTDADFRADPYNRYAASALDQMKNHRIGLALTHVLDVPQSSFQLRTTVYRNDYKRVWRKVNRMGGGSIATILSDPADPVNSGYHDVLTGERDTGSPAEYIWVGPNDRQFVSQGVQSTFTGDAITGPFSHKIETGIRFHNDEIRRRHTEDAFSMVNGELVYAGEATLTTAYNRATSYAMAVHATDAVTWDALTVTPGVRGEFILSETEDYANGNKANGFVTAFMPGVGAFYELIPGLGALGGVYRGFSPPAPGSDKSVSPEYSVNYEAGARFTRGALRVEAIGFYNDYQNLTDVCTLASGCLTDNLDRQFDAGRARIYGLEAYAAHDLALPANLKMPATVAYTFTRGEFLNTFESLDPIYGSVVSGDEVPYLPPHQLNFTLGVEHALGGVNGAFNYVARMREAAGSGDYIEGLTTDEQFWLDVGVFARPLPWLTIYGNVRNVTGEANLVARKPYGARVNAPRWVQVGAKAEF